MAINKNFVIKNGAEINTKLFVADANTQKVGIGTTRPSYTLHIMGPGDNTGGIGATYIYTTGITTTQALNVLGVSTFNAGPILLARGEQTGTPSQSLQVGTATTVSGVYVSGNIGVGQTLPSAKLEVVPTASETAGIFSGTTSADLVRITQLGSGNALVIEDSSNPDSTSVVVSGLGSVGIGTNVPRFLVDIDATSSTGTTAVYVRGDVKITGDLSVDDLILDQASLTTLSVTGFSTLGSFSAANARFAGITTGINAPGINTLGFVQSNTISVSGFSTLGAASATLLNVSGVSTFNGGLDANQGIDATGLLVTGVSTFSGGFNASQGADLARLRVTGITTLGDATSASIVVSGVSTLSGGLNASQGADLARLRVTGITTLGQTNTTGLSNAGVSTLGNATASTLVVSGFTTESGGTSATLLTVSGVATVSGGLLASQGVDSARLRVTGITTLGDATATNLSLAGITTGLNAPGISTLTSLTGTNANYSGISTISSLVATNVSVSGVTTTDSLKVDSSLDVYASNAVFHNDVTINGNLSIGGTSTIINAQSLVVEDKDIILGFTTSQLPNDNTANHGGIAVASTEGTPLVTFAVTGINTLPPTYKQIVWVRSGTMGAGTTDAWLFNYSVGIGSTLVPNNVRLAVGAVQVTEDGINARVGNLTHVRSTNINATGITTTNSLSIDATQVISSARQLQNIASLDAITTATIESAIANAPNTFTDLNVTGFSTLGAVSVGNLTLAGITTGLNVPGISTLTSVAGVSANFSGISTLASITSTNVNITGVTTVSGGLNASQGADLARLRVTGITTLGQANVTGLSNAGVSTLGNATASTLVVSGVTTVGVVTGATSIQAGVFYGDGSQLQNIISGVGIQSAGNVIGYGFTTLNFVGTGNTFAVNGTTVNISIAGGGGGGVTEIKTSGISTTNPIGVGSFATATYRSAAVLAQINQNAQYQVGRYLMIHDGTTVTLVEDAAVSTGSSMLGSFTGAIVGSNAELRVSMVSSGIATVTTKIDTITL